MSNTIKDKLLGYCRYQPRTHQDVRNKLYNGFNLRKCEVEALLTDMIEEGLVSEEAFAIAFAHDRFKLNGWGSRKIAQTLKQRGISDYCVKASLSQIDKESYEKQLQQLAAKKYASLKGNRFAKQQKTTNYLLQKGYSIDEAKKALTKLSNINS